MKTIMEFLEFMFQGFWHFFGCLIILGVIYGIIDSIFNGNKD